MLMLAAGTAQAEKRAALVIGNSTYKNVVQLDNPANDATAVAEMFREAKFDLVELRLDLGVVEFKRALRDFYQKTRDADVAVVYYAGHGIEVGGTNYMIPVDARLRSDYDAEDEAVALERIFRSIEATRRLRLVILDACRDNPFLRTMQRQIATRAIGQGLAKIEPMGSDTLVAYAAKAGSTAEDGRGEHSPFTQALLDNLTAPGLDIRIALGRVRDDVLARTGNRQEPYVYGSLGGTTVSLVPKPKEPEPKKPTIVYDPRGDYELAERVGTVSAWDAFLAVHGSGFFADLARQQRAKLAAETATTTVAALDRSTPQHGAGSSEEATPDRLAWEKVKDSSDPAELRAFVKTYASSPLAVIAQGRLDILERAAAERERAEAAREKAAREAERQKVEAEKRAKIAEAERLKAEQAAAAQRQKEEAARAALADAERKTAEEEAARQRDEALRRAKLAEAARLKAERDAARLREELEARAREAAAAAEKQQREAALKLEQEQRDRDLREEAERKAKAEAPNSPELVEAAQGELSRLGCFRGQTDGIIGPVTRRGVMAFLLNTDEKAAEQDVDDIQVTKDLVETLKKKEKVENCIAALEPEPKDEPAPVQVQRPSREKSVHRPRPEPRRAASPPRRERSERREARPAPRYQPPARARASASSRPSYGGRGGYGGGGGGGSVMHGIGF
ncbi:hypothetical protein with a TPR motif and a caspase domain protein [Rhodovulum sp. PH10]|uniref:caspase family protein n=1 Tax=Rhodovulum sp. PH10 TaxID=1187851 RepID=UPI00027C209C|nr:caspase family protein [Rhodovulum sp. PH10]EJW10342.1 hypothetical protein with a TPR motif and a caspase domain protein [Rhodovulum sp. PH10]